MKSNNAIGKRLLDQVRTEKASFDAVVADMNLGLGFVRGNFRLR